MLQGFENHTTIKETLTNNQFVARVLELEAQGAAFFQIRVITHNVGYSIECKIPIPSASETPPVAVQSELRY